MVIQTIGEGVSDEEVIRRILTSYTENKNLAVSALWPKNNIEPAGWTKVFAYCSSQEFRQALPFTDYVVVQIDTDIFGGAGIPNDYIIPDFLQLDTAGIVNAVRSFLIQAIGGDFYNQHGHQIIFAIAVNEIECWLLPAYFPTQKTKAGKVAGCISTLNEVLNKEEGFTIGEKRIQYYQKMCKRLKKKSDLQKFAAMNPSLGIFLDELADKLPQVAS